MTDLGAPSRRPRRGPAARRARRLRRPTRAYKAALGFEKVLLGELVKEMTASTPSLTDGPRADAVNDAMTDALADAGGIGLAPQLYQTLQRSAS